MCPMTDHAEGCKAFARYRKVVMQLKKSMVGTTEGLK